MRAKPYNKKLISFSEDSKYFLDKIQKMSVSIGLSESRIIEECMWLGFVCLYSPESLDKIKALFKKRHGTMTNLEYITKIITMFNQEVEVK